MSPSPGTLFVVATPIGNLEDLSPRAARLFGQVSLVVAEDTRVTRKLLGPLGSGKRLLSCYRENEAQRTPEVLGVLESGESVVLCTDAGSPGLSDPGQALVAAAHARGLPVAAVPGPSAVSAAVSVCGFAGPGFRFAGFLPRKGKDRGAALARIVTAPEPVVLFEAPGRLGATLTDLGAACGPQREAVVARELSKLHEEVVRGTLAELAGRFSGRVRGEVTLVVDAAPAGAVVEPSDEVILLALAARPAGERRREKVEAVAVALGLPRKRVYALALGTSPESTPSDPDR